MKISSDPRILTREAARALADRVLAIAAAASPTATRVTMRSTWAGNTRFAGGGITTSGGSTDTSVTITSTFGRRRASATTNVLDDASLRRTVDLSQRLARLTPEDPELLPELSTQNYAAVSAYAPATADLTPEARALAVRRLFEGVNIAAAGGAINPESLVVAGFLEAEAGMTEAVANSAGLFAYHAATSAGLSTTVRTPDGTGSGYAADGARDWAAIDPASLGRRATTKALASRNPVAIEPGRYTVVLEPQAVADLVPLMMGSFSARTADEGRSPFSQKGGGTKLGQTIADPRVTLYSDPADPDLLAQPFDGEGLPVGRTVWIENGVLRNLGYTRFWAQQKGVAPTGGAGTLGGFGGGGIAGGLKMAGGTKTLDELIAGTTRGVLVTRFYYIRFLDQRTVMLTGLTRDGTFLIENGKVTHPVKNFRFNDSPLLMLARIDDIGRAERTAAGLVMPSLRVKDFNFSSLSDAV